MRLETTPTPALPPRTRPGRAAAPQPAAPGHVLAADVGGTHTRVALVAPAGDGRVDVRAHRKYASADASGLDEILADFLDAHPARTGVDQAVIATAGVALDDVVLNANLPWPVSLASLRAALALRTVRVINDFEAAAHAAQCMDAATSTLLTPGVGPAEPGPVLVVGPGTGLGAAVRVPHRGGVVVLPTESGQAAFAPGNEREIELLRFLQRREAHVPTEHLVSGPGLVNLHVAMAALHGRVPVALTPAAIVDAARHGEPAAEDAVLTFCALLGSAIGDLALTTSARAVFIAGGIVPRLRDLLARSAFHERLLAKGAMRAVLERVPVRLIEDDRVGVIGAASWAFAQAPDPGPPHPTEPPAAT